MKMGYHPNLPKKKRPLYNFDIAFQEPVREEEAKKR